MTSFPQAVVHGLRGLLRFEGRDTRSQFWFYVLGLVLAQQALGVVLMIPLFFGMVGRMGPGSLGAVATDPSPMAVPFHWFVAAAIVLTLFGVFLLAAAIVRRLHDSGLRGWWGALPLPFLLVGLGAFVSLTSGMARGPEAAPGSGFAVLFLDNAVYLLALVVLIVLLVRESDAGPNRYGPPPTGRS